MTSFQPNDQPETNTENKKDERPAELVITTPESRVKSDPVLWNEAGLLADMLAYCRPHNSRTERKFIAKYLIPLGVKFDKSGNAYKQIGDNPTVLWSSHTDTVHAVHGFQKIQYWHNKKGDVFFEVKHGAKRSSCLGADDTAGIWLMLQMIEAQVPGLYIFHRGEECGRIGSKWIAEKNKDSLKGIKFAIAFDRRDENSIITYQSSARCCSDEFATSLADQLGMSHKADTGGSYTDTASYVDLVAECTNISAGYYNAHCANENVNVDYLFRLRDAILKIDVTKLVEKRKPGENTRLYGNYSGGSYGNNCWSEYGHWENDHWSKSKKEETTVIDYRGGLSGIRLREIFKGRDWMDYYQFDAKTSLWFPIEKHSKNQTKITTKRQDKPSYAQTLRMIRDHDAIIADLLESLGYGPSELKEYLIEINGDTPLLQ